MNEHEILSALKQHPFLRGLPDNLLERLVSCARHITVTPGQFLGREREPANALYLIQSGRVSIELQRTVRESVTLQTLGEGDIVGWSWLVPPHHWQFDARVLDTVHLLTLDAACLRDKCEQDHELGYALVKRLVTVIAGRLAATRRRLLEMPT
jgi:CRP/FNR family cyclic AMP-dependent transcriptional regulator